MCHWSYRSRFVSSIPFLFLSILGLPSNFLLMKLLCAAIKSEGNWEGIFRGSQINVICKGSFIIYCIFFNYPLLRETFDLTCLKWLQWIRGSHNQNVIKIWTFISRSFHGEYWICNFHVSGVQINLCGIFAPWCICLGRTMHAKTRRLIHFCDQSKMHHCYFTLTVELNSAIQFYDLKIL